MYKWKQDSPELLNECFNFDWENGRVPKFAKTEEEANKLKELTLPLYQHIKDSYKHYASMNPV